MSYRVEVSANNRAGCQDALCRSNNVKIMKGEIRFGVWIEGPNFQSWRWRHWGCVSGKTIENIRNNLGGPLADGDEYNWDLMDGLDDMPPEYEEKIKLAITEGKIADEDWKGDPEYNVLGRTGIRGRTPKKKQLDEEAEGVEIALTSETPIKSEAKKRSRVKDEDEDEEAKPTKKRASKTKKEDDNDEDEAKPVRKPRAKKADKVEKEKEEEVKSEESKPVKKPRARRSAKKEVEQDDKLDAVKTPTKPRARKAAKKEEQLGDGEMIKEEHDDKPDLDVKPPKRSRVKKGTKEEADADIDRIKAEDIDDAAINVKPAITARGRKRAKEEHNGESEVKMEDQKHLGIDIKPAKKTRGKKVVKKEEFAEESYPKMEEHDDESEDTKPTFDCEVHEREADNDVKPDAEGKFRAPMPDDPLEQIASAFCDRDGPLVRDFNEMVEAQEVAGTDWDAFLQKKFGNMIDAGEIAEDDYHGFLQKMHEREVASKEPVPAVPKKGRKAKTVPTAAKFRGRRRKSS